MYAKTMGIYWLLVAKIRISRYFISGNRRLSKPLVAVTRVIIWISLKKRLNVEIFILGCIRCVRWSPSGDMLASALDDSTVSLLDFKTGKVLYTGSTSDKSNYLFQNTRSSFTYKGQQCQSASSR